MKNEDGDYNLGNIFFCKNGDISMNTDHIPDAEFTLYIYYLFILRTYKFHF